jgi:hypothetical protein
MHVLSYHHDNVIIIVVRRGIRSSVVDDNIIYYFNQAYILLSGSMRGETPRGIDICDEFEIRNTRPCSFSYIIFNVFQNPKHRTLELIYVRCGRY